MSAKCVPYLRGDTIHRDYVHWRMGDYSNLGGNFIYVNDSYVSDTRFPQDQAPAAPFYPIGFTLDEMLKLSWRVKKWLVSGSLSVTLNDGVHAPGTLTFTFASTAISSAIFINNLDPNAFGTFTGVNHNWSGSADDESRIMAYADPRLTEWFVPLIGAPTPVVPPTYSPSDAIDQINAANQIIMYADNQAGKITDTVTSPYIDYFVGAGRFASSVLYLMGQQPLGKSMGQPQDQVYFNSASNLFYPQIFFSIRLFQQIFVTPFISLFTTRNKSGSDTVIGNITILGHSIPIYLNQDQADGYTYSNWMATIDVTPKEYWPFLTRTGLPVYDSVTGDQLNDPFS